jgi:hypothetical protein
VQVLRTALWHLDTLVDHPAGQSRAEAIAAMAQAFREEWTVERQGWEEVLALLQTLGDLARLRWDELKGRLNSREWREAQTHRRGAGRAAPIGGIHRAGRPRAAP